MPRKGHSVYCQEEQMHTTESPCTASFAVSILVAQHRLKVNPNCHMKKCSLLEQPLPLTLFLLELMKLSPHVTGPFSQNFTSRPPVRLQPENLNGFFDAFICATYAVVSFESCPRGDSVSEIQLMERESSMLRHSHASSY